MAGKGTVKWYNATKGFGFIRPDGGGDDVFIHVSEVTRAGIDTLTDGDAVTFDLGPSERYPGKSQAINISNRDPERRAKACAQHLLGFCQQRFENPPIPAV